jgi:hypothetical protein
MEGENERDDAVSAGKQVFCRERIAIRRSPGVEQKAQIVTSESQRQSAFRLRVARRDWGLD